MRLSHSMVTSVVMTAIALCLAAPSAYAGGRGGLWWPPAMHPNAHGGPQDQRHAVKDQANGRWDNSRVGWNDGRDDWSRRRRHGCGFGGRGGAGWGGCQIGFWNEGADNHDDANVFVAPAYSGNFEGGVIHAAAVVAPAPVADSNDGCSVLRLTRDKSGNFAGAHRVNGCLTGPRVINLSARE